MPSPFVTQHPADFTLHLPIADPQRFDVQFAPLDGDLYETSLA